jgi:hypothetical protein
MAMAPVTYWINVVVPRVDEAFVNPDDLEDDQVIPQVQDFIDSIVAEAEARGWVVRDYGCGYHDDRPPQW